MNICIICTGGTIDKDYPRSTGGYAFEIDEPAVGRILQEHSFLSIKYKIISVCKKDSTDIDNQDRERICEVIRKEKSLMQRFLITHGTDTLLETANYIEDSGCCHPTTSGDDGAVVVCTGAMKPERFKDSDATFNIGGSITALGILELPKKIERPLRRFKAVYICMGGQLIHCKQSCRDANGFFVEQKR